MRDAPETKDAESPINTNQSEQSVPKEEWRSVWDFAGWCAFFRIHGHWCVTGICRYRTVTHADTAIVLESSWRPGNLSRFSGRMNPDRRERPKSGRRLLRRDSSISHTSARSAARINSGFFSADGQDSKPCKIYLDAHTLFYIVFGA